MHRNTWKGHERKVAEFFWTRRTPLSGENSGHNTHSDSLSVWLYLELKRGGSCPRSWDGISKLFRDVGAKAWAEHKWPVLVLKERGTADNVANWRAWTVIRLQDNFEVIACVPLHTIRTMLVRHMLPEYVYANRPEPLPPNTVFRDVQSEEDCSTSDST